MENQEMKQKESSWTIRYDERQELWIAENGWGVCVYADERRKLDEWIYKKTAR